MGHSESQALGFCVLVFILNSFSVLVPLLPPLSARCEQRPFTPARCEQAMLNFLLPDIFSSSEQFDEWFNPEDQGDGGSGEDVLHQLHKLLRPFLLRRLKKEVRAPRGWGMGSMPWGEGTSHRRPGQIRADVARCVGEARALALSFHRRM